MSKKRLSKSDRELFEKAQELGRMKDEPKLLLVLQKLVENRPDIAILHGSLARSFEQNGDLEAAEVEFRKAVELDPESELLSLNLFIHLKDKNRYVEALDETKRFMLISDSEDYREIVKEISEKWDNGSE